jgi:hypothetical protein
MINAIIVDDEKDGAEVLQFLIKQNCPQSKYSFYRTFCRKCHFIHTAYKNLI